jgi:hypothetical protein
VALEKSGSDTRQRLNLIFITTALVDNYIRMGEFEKGVHNFDESLKLKI